MKSAPRRPPARPAGRNALAQSFLAEASATLLKEQTSRIERCLRILDDESVWWRPNPASNSVGNLVLHLSGNLRQWIVSGLGGAADVRQREREFAEQGPLPKAALLRLLRQTVEAAVETLERLTAADLKREYQIQGFRRTGLAAIFHVVTHFAHHTGQIIWATKQDRARDLRFTKLPPRPPVEIPPAGKRVRLTPTGDMWAWLDQQQTARGRAAGRSAARPD